MRPVILEPLRAVSERFVSLDDWNRHSISATIEEVAKSFDINMGKLGQPIRVAVTGGPVSPPIDVTLLLIGRARVVERLDRAIEFISLRADSHR